MQEDKILVTQSSMPSLEEYVQEIKSIFHSKWLTNNGIKHQTLENNLKEYLGVDNITLFVNGHLALATLLQSLNFPRGSEIITTPYSFASTTHAIVQNGLNPIFCDIEPDHYTLDPSKIEALITDKTVAILPVHVYGNVCNVKNIAEIAQRHNLKVIYDAAHVFGVKYKGQSITKYGDASMFSFHATKVFNTIEGGAIVSNHPELHEQLEIIKNFGINPQDHEDALEVGTNAKMNEFAAAMGICNLRHIDAEIAKRRQVHDQYFARLSNVPGIKLCQPQDEVTQNYAYFPVVFDNEIFKKDRDTVFKQLEQQNISARRYFYPLISDYTCYKDYYDSSQTPVAKWVAQRVLTLPMYADLSSSDINKICNIILG